MDNSLAKPLGQRLTGVDILRGAVMVLMALDHTRDFFSHADFSPTDLARTSAGWFFTRWITHFCAPVFIFLAGAGACLSAARHPGKRSLSRFLLARGVWIMFLGVSFESLIWCFTPDFSEISGAVLWAIGWSMVVLAGLVFLPPPLVAAFGLAMAAGHNLFDAWTPQDFGVWGPAWTILHAGGVVRISERLAFDAYYPLVPWIGVMAAGYGFGRLLALDKARQNTLLPLLGAALTLGFVWLRYHNRYGDPNPWAPQDSLALTYMSFLNCHKYPPSLCYLLMTLGPAIFVLPFMERLAGRAGGVLAVFGRTPMFFYLLHLPLIVGLALAHAGFASGLAPLSGQLLKGFPQAYGYGLPAIYLIWMGVVALLYPLCRWFDAVKRRKAHWLLQYF